jgi:feruloyl esterase
MIRKLLASAVLLLMAPAAPALQAPALSAAEAARCASLAGQDFTGITDAPTRIVSSEAVAPTASAAAYCRVRGTIQPQIGFELQLPASWNGKFVEVGCGSWCGVITVSDCRDPVKRGYACMASDLGHKGSPIDLTWAKDNLQAQLDFGYRAVHAAALAGKAIAKRHYAAAPSRSYYNGCSSGGYHGLVSAQRFPWDFDGIVAGAPDIDQEGANFRYLWFALAKRDAEGKQLFDKAQISLVHDAAVAACDAQDGLKDGIISNPLACGFRPESLLCKPGKASSCLSQTQVTALNKIYSGPTDAAGRRTSRGSFLVGSELRWAGEFPLKTVEDFFRYAFPGFTTGPDWKGSDFDFDKDYKRLGLAPHLENNNPDLRRFKAAGGKLIVWHGLADATDPPMPVIDYYETVERTMGGRQATMDFFRMFLIPGMDHCRGGAGGLDVDWLTALENWVEKGKAPDVLVGNHKGLGAEPSFTRPVYPHPAYARYKGKGDPNVWTSFRPAPIGQRVRR